MLFNCCLNAYKISEKHALIALNRFSVLLAPTELINFFISLSVLLKGVDLDDSNTIFPITVVAHQQKWA